MITKRLHDPKQQMTVILVAAAFTISSIIAFSNTHHIWASEGISTQTSCVDNQPCHTMLCSETQPCKVSETPNTDFALDADETNMIPQPLEGETVQQPLESTGPIGVAPFSDSLNNNYWEDQEEYLEERQDMMEDAEYE